MTVNRRSFLASIATTPLVSGCLDAPTADVSRGRVENSTVESPSRPINETPVFEGMFADPAVHRDDWLLYHADERENPYNGRPAPRAHARSVRLVGWVADGDHRTPSRRTPVPEIA